MMALTRLIVCVVLGLAALAGSTSAETLSLAELNEVSYELAKALSKYFPEINSILEAKLPGNNDPEENMEAVIDLVASNNFDTESEKIALKLVADLYAYKNLCTYLSYKIFAENYIANDLISQRKTLGRNHVAELRTQIMLNHYARIHAKNCGAVYRRDFRKKFPKVDKKSLQRIEGAFNGVFGYDGPAVTTMRHAEKRQYLAMELDNLSEKPVPEVTEKILENIMEMVKESDMWNTLKPSVDESSGQRLIPKPTNRVFDEFLFEPCASYERVLGETLSSARLDAFVEEEGKGFLADEQLYEAMMHSRLCKKVLEEQSNLKEIFIGQWMSTMRGSL